MDASQIYILIAVVSLLLVAILLFVMGKKKKKSTLTPLTGLAFGFIIAGIVFGDSRLVGYSLMGVGVTLAIIDMIIKLKNKKKKK